MSVAGAKTAIYLGIGIVAAIAAVSVGLSTLDMAVTPVPAPASPGQEAPPPVDKSGFKQAPKLVGIHDYINADPASLQEKIDGSVVLYDIWTYSCINCIRTLPYITAWDDKYSDDGLLIIGVHSPEFEFEKDLSNVQAAVDKHGIAYPVVLDNDMDTWSAFENRYWPRKYIADAEGYIRYDHIGEGGYEETERVIQALLSERMRQAGMEGSADAGLVDVQEFEHSGATTPELYFGYAFAAGRNLLGNEEGFSPGSTVSYSIPDEIALHHFYIDGDWTNTPDGMRLVSESGTVLLPYQAKEVNIVAGGQAELQVFLDGEPIGAEHAGADVSGGAVQVGEHRLYRIVSSESSAVRTLELSTSDPGLEMFTFTFG